MAGENIFAGIKNIVQEKMYQSTFDFASFEINDDDKNYIIEREEILFLNFKKMSSSLYEICKALYEIKLKFKDDGGSFAAWYRHNHLSKDKVSELLKRYELFIQAPNQKEYVSALSIPAVKLLTKKDIEFDTLDQILQLELKDVEEIADKIEEIQPSEIKEEKKENKVKNPLLTRTVKKYRKTIEKATTLTELANHKKELLEYVKQLKELVNEIEQKEKSRENENNLNLFEKECVFQDDLERIIVLEFSSETGMYEAVRYLTVEDYKERSFREMLSIIAPEKSLKIAKEKFQAYAITQAWKEYKGNENNSQYDPSPRIEVSEKKVYRDNRGWVFFVRSGLGENTFKAFYAKNVEDYQRNIRCHAVKSLEWQSTENLAQVDLDKYAANKKMEVLRID